jgi:hypothetical protein
MSYANRSLTLRLIPYRMQIVAILCAAIFLTFVSASFAQADDPAVPGVRWGSRIIAVEADKITVKLMMATGNCVAPPMECTNTEAMTDAGLNISGTCTSGPPKYGTAGETYTLDANKDQTYQVGHDADIWMGDTGPTFNLPACITAEW